MGKSALKNILIASNTDGAHFVFRGQLIDDLCEKGYYVDSLTLRASPEDVYDEKIRKISRNYYRQNDIKFGILNSLKSFKLIKKILKENRYDVIHVYGHEVALYFVALSRLLSNTRFIITFTGLGRFFSEDATLAQKLIKWLIIRFYKAVSSKVHRFIFLNTDDLAALGSYIELEEKSIVLRGEGFTPDHTYHEQSICPCHDPIKVLFAGRFLIEKGVLELLAAIKVQKNSCLEFIFAGYIPEEIKVHPDVRELLSGSIPNCRFVGHIESIPKYLNNVDVVVLPTFYMEGAPRILIEALASGKYLITTSAPGAKDTVVDGKNGRIVAPKNIPQLTMALEALTPKLVENARTHSLAHFYSNYDYKVISDGIIDSYFAGDV